MARATGMGLPESGPNPVPPGVALPASRRFAAATAAAGGCGSAGGAADAGQPIGPGACWRIQPGLLLRTVHLQRHAVALATLPEAAPTCSHDCIGG